MITKTKSVGRSVVVKQEGELKLDAKKFERVLKPAVVGKILDHTDKGLDKDGKELPDYSRGYERKLERMGEDTKPDQRVTGAMMNSVQHRKTTQGATGIDLIFAPGTGTSASVRPPMEKHEGAKVQAKNDAAYQKAAAKAGGPISPAVAERLRRQAAKRDAAYAFARGRAIKTGARSPPHNVLMAILAKMGRNVLGLSEEEMQKLARILEQSDVWKV